MDRAGPDRAQSEFLEIEPFSGASLADVERLLQAASLPVDGLETALGLALVARRDQTILGFAGVEPYGRLGLLRSVVVAPEARGYGLGRRLVAAAEELATGNEIGELFLLTEMAASWFPRLGYEAVERSAVPAAVAASAEFRGACPESAIAMHKELRERAGGGR